MFLYKKNFRYVFNENTDQFCMEKNFRSVFNENIDLFCMQKNSKSVFNENTDLIFFFFVLLKKNVFSRLLQILKFKE